MIYVYGFCVPAEALLPILSGIQAEVQFMHYGGLCAVIEAGVDYDAIATDDQQLMQAVLTHDRVLQEIFQHVTVLPLQFGTQFYSEEGLLQHLEEHQQTYCQQLAQLGNQGEYLLKLIPVEQPEPPPPNQAKGRDYFLAKKQRYQVQADYQQQQQAELAELKRAIAQSYTNWKHSEPKDGIERIYLLLPRDAEADIQTQCQTWQEQFPRWTLFVSAPLPPYHFV